MYREVTMVEVKEVLRLWRAGLPRKRLAAQLGLDPKTVRRYLGAATAAGVRADGHDGHRRRGPRDAARAAAVGGRPRGDGWAQCAAQRPAIERWLADGLRLTKIRKLLARQGVAITYATLYRFAVLRAAVWPDRDHDPGARWPARPGAAARHGLGRLAHAAGRDAAPVSRVDLHGGPLAASLRVSDLRGDDRAGDRGVRSGVGLLRRRLRGHHSR